MIKNILTFANIFLNTNLHKSKNVNFNGPRGYVFNKRVVNSNVNIY